MPVQSHSYRPDDREISAGQRVLCTGGAQYNYHFPQPKTHDKVVFEDGEVDDTLQLMERVIHTYIDDTKKLFELIEAWHVMNESCDRAYEAECLRASWQSLIVSCQASAIRISPIGSLNNPPALVYRHGALGRLRYRFAADIYTNAGCGLHV